MEDFKWNELKTPVQGEPVPGEVATVMLPVKVCFVWSDRIVADVDEHNNPIEFREGFVMEVMDQQTFVYKGEERMTDAYTMEESEIKNIPWEDLNSLTALLNKYGKDAIINSALNYGRTSLYT